MASTDVLSQLSSLISFVSNVQVSPGKVGISQGQSGQPTITLSSGAEMPLLGLGTWQSDTGLVKRAVEHAIDTGYRHFDCAWIYGNEEEVGQGLAVKFAEGAVQREDVFVTSKLWNSFHHPDDVEAHIRDTLSNLQLDYLDLYLMHWPVAVTRGFRGMPMDENGLVVIEDIPLLTTWRAMERLVDLGLTKSIGVSNFSPAQMQDLLNHCRIPPAVDQAESHPYLTQPHWVEFCQKNNIAFEAYSPLGNPSRPDGMKRLVNLCELDDPILKRIASKYGKSVAQICIKFQIERGCVVIPKSTTPARIDQNFDVFDFTISAEDMETISGLNRNRRFCQDPGTEHIANYPFGDELPRRVSLKNLQVIPSIGLATSIAGVEQVERLVGTAVDCGYRMLDCSSNAENERGVGLGIASAVRRGLVKRKDLVVIGKLSSAYHHPEDVEKALRSSLQNFGCDYLDLYVMEQPYAFARGKYASGYSQTGNYEFDETLTLEQTWKAMEKLVDQGLARAIGVANVNLSQLQRLCNGMKYEPAVVQNECHLYNRDEDVLGYCLENGIVYQATKPVGPKRAVEEEVVLDVANWRSRTQQQVLIRWQLERECSVIVEPRTPERDEIRSSFDVFSFQLGPAVDERISGCSEERERMSVVRGTESARDFAYA